jgi:hypothetical protein
MIHNTRHNKVRAVTKVTAEGGGEKKVRPGGYFWNGRLRRPSPPASRATAEGGPRPCSTRSTPDPRGRRRRPGHRPLELTGRTDRADLISPVIKPNAPRTPARTARRWGSIDPARLISRGDGVEVRRRPAGVDPAAGAPTPLCWPNGPCRTFSYTFCRSFSDKASAAWVAWISSGWRGGVVW